MMNERLEIARYRLEDRIRESERDALHRTDSRRRSGTARHRIAAGLHRLADRVEPSVRGRRPALSMSGR
ncbi:MAG: hypothetical protein ACRDP9_08655 [Kribbellaceae bacterium]|nr:hypothetical protein [Kribbellaceae bacterium]